MSEPNWREKVIFAYIDEPPFAQTNPDGSVSGCDVIVARHILQQIDVQDIELRRVTFPDLMPGVANHDWTINTPIFITPERAKTVMYSHPVWALADGFIVRNDSAATLNSYHAVAQDNTARIAIIRNQVQHQSALDAGIPPERITIFETQHDVIAALLAGEVDAYPATAMGHRTFLKKEAHPELTVVDLVDADGKSLEPAFAGYSFAKDSNDLVVAFNQALGAYIGTPEHHDLMLAHGFSQTELERVIEQYS
ncbi:MAG: transporter substrate-binding domain-containing protein [Aggregatilineales bacterium]